MNCTINSASNFSGLQAGISQISPAQLAAPVRKSTLDRPFIFPILGPILPLLKWSDEADVIARANDTIYGLGASVWGKDLEAVERIGSQLEAGTVWLNEVHQYSPFQAFGGHKQSGLGCENSLHGLMEYTNWQTTALNKQWTEV